MATLSTTDFYTGIPLKTGKALNNATFSFFVIHMVLD